MNEESYIVLNVGQDIYDPEIMFDVIRACDIIREIFCKITEVYITSTSTTWYEKGFLYQKTVAMRVECNNEDLAPVLYDFLMWYLYSKGTIANPVI